LASRRRLKAALANTNSPLDLLQPAQLHLAQPDDGLQPSERGFDPRPGVETPRVAGMARRAPVYRTAAAPCEVLRDVRCRARFARHADEVAHVIGLVGADCPTPTRGAPSLPLTHWSTRSLGRQLGVQHTVIARAWRDAGLQPHRLERYMRSTDPEFETKAADVIGLYLDPPQHAVVFCIDEKTAIQALDRLDPVLPLSPGRAERHGFEYHRHGTLSLYAALNTQTGAAGGRTAARHTSAAFVEFLETVVDTQPRRREIHIIVDNLSAHKTQQVRTFLVLHPRVHLHYTPTYSSWLNQVELWFAKIERDVTARGIFTSVTDLTRKLMRYIKHYNKTATRVRWAYADPSRRIA
jgi:transposase